MGMFDKITPQRVVDIVEYSNMRSDEMVYKFPQEGVADIKWGAQLIVQETQAAVFFKDGKALDVFGPGRYTLSTQNIPFLAQLVEKFTQDQKTPFQAQVYFVNTKVFQDMKWGTPQPIDLQDPDLGWVSLRVFGTYTIKVIDPQLFVNTLVGTEGMFSTAEIQKFLKGSIRSNFSTMITTRFQSYGTIRKETNKFNAEMKFKVKEDFEKYGIEVRDFFIQDISVPEEVQEAFKERARMGALGDMGKFTQYKAATAMGDMAKKPAGSGTDPMSAGMGMGMGMMMPQMMAQAMSGAMSGQQQQVAPAPQQAPAAPAHPAQVMVACPSCQAQVPQGSKFCSNCGNPTAPPKPKCPGCQAEVHEGAKFCPNCGQSMVPQAAKCTNCGSELAPGAKFCTGCGQKQE
ncbi:MAG: SPFH domain-containing protein [Firmicutes bacterium]|nr:SPFH domain-containing protein [Bacillota bacterium]